MTVDELLARMSSPEFAEWIAYFRLEAEGAPAAPDPVRADLERRAREGVRKIRARRR